MSKKKSRLMASFLAMVMAVTTLAHPVIASPILLEADSVQVSILEEALTNELGSIYGYEFDFLTTTMTHTPIGVFGFEGEYALSNNHDEMVNIVVHFRTPSAVALRLIEEAKQLGRMSLSSDDFTNDANVGHYNFADQLSMLPMPFSANGTPRILSEHNMLFNGVFMEVPVGMVEMIASLPEVFSVTPAMMPQLLTDMYAVADANFGVGVGTLANSEWDSETLRSMLDGHGVLNAPTNFRDSGYIWHPEFNQGARLAFELDYINNDMGITGQGIRVGLIDTGVDYRHPAYWHMLIPVADGAGFVRDENGQYWSLPGANFLPAPVSGRAWTPNTTRGSSDQFIMSSPMEMIHGPAHSTHGTHVAGTILGMAPNVQIYAFRTLTNEPGGAGNFSAPLMALEFAYYLQLDILNNSWGYTGNTNAPWYSFTWATNLAALAGMISTNSTGNDGVGGATPTAGLGGWFSLGGGGSTASLGISVASGQGANRLSPGFHVNGESFEITTIGSPAPEFPVSDILEQDLDFVWFGRMEIPAAGFDNPAFPAFIDNVRAMMHNTIGIDNLEGKVAVINRGSGEFVTMAAMAETLGAVALIVVNNEYISDAQLPQFIALMDRLPTFGVRPSVGQHAFGVAASTAQPVANIIPVMGTVNFGDGYRFIPSLDRKTPSSSIGPLGPVGVPGWDAGVGADGELMDAIMHIFPSITAPGNSIVSTWTISHPTMIDGRSYNAIGGTSMAAPAIAGIAALLLEYHDAPWVQSGNLTNRSVEVQARIMQTARPLADYAGNYSVNQVGPGFVNPLAALRTPAFATTVHPIPFMTIVESPEDVPYQQVPWNWREFEDHTMASLSFGRVPVIEGEGGQTATLPITIHGASSWTFDRLEFNAPTMELRNPANAWGGNWGPRLVFADPASVEYTIVSTGNNAYEIYFVHDGNIANRGFSEGHIFFTDGVNEIFMIFGTYFEMIDPPVLRPMDGTGIWRPIISGFVSPNHDDFDDIREFPAGWVTNPGFYTMNVRSNMSPVTFGFADDSEYVRHVRFYVGPYGSEFGDSDVLFHSQFNNVSPNTTIFSANLLRPIVGGSLWNIGNADWQAASGGYVLSEGVHTLFMFVENPLGDDLIVPKHFVVTNDIPTIEIDEDAFYFMPDADYVVVTGQVSSFGQDMAIEHGLVGMTGWVGSTNLIPANTGAFDYTQSWLRVNGDTVPVNADGTFSFNLELEDIAERTPFQMVFSDGFGVSITRAVDAGAFGFVSTGAANRSDIATFEVAPMFTVNFMNFHNGHHGALPAITVPVGTDIELPTQADFDANPNAWGRPQPGYQFNGQWSSFIGGVWQNVPLNEDGTLTVTSNMTLRPDVSPLPITLTFFARSPLSGGGWHNGTAWSHSILTITLEEGDYLDWYTINTAYEAHVYSGGFENDRTEGWFAQGPGITRTLFEDEAQISFDFFAEILGNPTQRRIFIDTVAGDIIPVPYVYFTVAF
ncbi:MAG: S8 family serine peptidase, partial [Defluviitaleaceae bacterium]|nr:S8 family serine peptidase [Defluviitaleaceae bacterium]